MSVISLDHHYFILRERSDRRACPERSEGIFSAEIEPVPSKIPSLRSGQALRFAQDEVDPPK
jgi:hypothetical protein